MTGTALSVIVVDQWSVVRDVGEFITHSASLLLTALRIPFSRVQCARFVRVTWSVIVYVIAVSSIALVLTLVVESQEFLNRVRQNLA